MSCIQDNMGNFFRPFDNSLLEPTRMNSQIWFERRTKTICRPCKDYYAPHQDQQHYFSGCKEWIHIQCLDEDFGPGSLDYTASFNPVIDPSTLPNDQLLEFLELCEQFLDGPTVWGHGGMYETYNWNNNWVNTGSSVQKGLVRRWQEARVVPADWVKSLGEDFLEDFLEKDWVFYICFWGKGSRNSPFLIPSFVSFYIVVYI
jgi:hypothetical protein